MRSPCLPDIHFEVKHTERLQLYDARIKHGMTPETSCHRGTPGERFPLGGDHELC